MYSLDIYGAAKRLSLSRLNGTVIEKLPARYRPTNETEAYLIQDDLHEILGQTKFGEVAGHKIGCTTSVMQDFLNIRNPCSGGIFAPTSQHLAGTFSAKFIVMLVWNVKSLSDLVSRLGQDSVPIVSSVSRELSPR